MTLSNYLDLYEVLEDDTSSRNERRAFGLAHPKLKDDPSEQLLFWSQSQRSKLHKPLLSETFTGYLYKITFVLASLAFVLGLFSGIALLNYHGKEPVNVIYFMAMVIALPLFTMGLTLFSMLRAKSRQSVLVHVSPAYWMERVLGLFPNKMGTKLKEHLAEIKISPLISNFLVIKRSQVLALFFSSGLLISLFLMVATRDIAFAWSTTLSVSAEEFHALLHTLSLPWESLFPSAVPSLELVQQSQYYRLGERISPEMINHASLLGEWWKFLLCATLFYALFLRLLLFFFSSFALKRAVKRSSLSLEGARQLLSDMNEVLINSLSTEAEKVFVPNTSVFDRQVHTLDASYDVMLGWAIESGTLKVIADDLSVSVPNLFEVGGNNTLEADKEIVNKCHGEVLLLVKAWEPPTMDFVDFLNDLLVKVDKVIVMPIGTMSQGYVSKEKEQKIWAAKLLSIPSKHVWLKV